MTPRPMPERMSELAAERALFGLGAAEALELERLQAEHGASEPSELELAAAELDLALAGQTLEPLPDAVRVVLARAGEQWNAAPKLAQSKAEPPRAVAPADARRAAIWPIAGWALAAAALVVAILGWLRDPRPARTVEPEQTYTALRSAPGVLNPSFNATEHAPGASGDVVWSQSSQQGVVHLVGLPANDPTVEQYQLWIVDADQKQPIDGGVFDVAGGEGWIAIDPKLAVARPTAFAITLEKPGGVVVSALDRVVLMATL